MFDGGKPAAVILSSPSGTMGVSPRCGGWEQTALKKYALFLLVPVAALAWWVYRTRSSPPEIPFTKVRRETLVSTLVTNGRAEPLEWVTVRAERSGLVAKVHVEKGTRVVKGAPLADLQQAEAVSELSAAEARVAQARAELETLDKGGRASELAELDGAIERARLDLQTAEKEHQALARLEAKQAATRREVQEARDRAELARVQVRSLENKRASLVTVGDRSSAQARLRDAEAAAGLARKRLADSVIRASMSGVVYQVDVRPGSYLNAGDPVASIGRLDKMRVRVYVDEPELGRVGQGMPVTITWDARPGLEWKGTVAQMPTQIVALGTRQVGEVACVIENPGLELLPGTNINAEIRSRVVENALTIPKETLRRDGERTGVFVLASGAVSWRDVTPGATSVTRTQILKGLSEGESVALPSEKNLRDGQPVQPVYP